MVKNTESQKAKAIVTGRDSNFAKFTVGITDETKFYRLVSLLNKHVGHGRVNWTMSGRPLKKIRRASQYNSLITRYNSISEHLTKRAVPVNVLVNPGHQTVMSMILLEFERDK